MSEFRVLWDGGQYRAVAKVCAPGKVCAEVQERFCSGGWWHLVNRIGVTRPGRLLWWATGWSILEVCTWAVTEAQRRQAAHDEARAGLAFTGDVLAAVVELTT